MIQPLARAMRAVLACMILVCVAAILVLALGSCSGRTLQTLLVPDQRPSIMVTEAPTQGQIATGYSYLFKWAGNDPDGSIDHYLYVVDPSSTPGADTAWVVTHENRRQFDFAADSTASDTRSQRFHVVIVVAVDGRGLRSSPAIIAFTASTLAPTVSIVEPLPSHLLIAQAPASIHIVWSGSDADGPTKRPVRYKYTLLTNSSPFSISTALANPDSLRRAYAPAFAGWDSVPGNVSNIDYRNLTVGQDFLFVIVAIDTAGAYSPVFSADQNMLHFQSNVAQAAGPVLTLYNESFSYAFAYGGFFSDPQTYIHTELAADVPLSMHWIAKATPGNLIQGARWAVDIDDVDDQTPRSDEAMDLKHWSQWTSGDHIELPAFHPATGQISEAHHFYLEAQDSNQQLSLGVVEFLVVRATFDHELLIVDDTWVTQDVKLSSGCVDRPRLAWPTASELDTFLLAVGNKPIKCYPAGSLSSPGIFAGYSFDSVRTHSLSTGTISLVKLDHYRNIVWMVDGPSTYQTHLSTGIPPPLSQLQLATALGQTDPLATWVQQGGRLWLLGGGAAGATQLDYENPRTSFSVFSSADSELTPGRFMYDLSHWQSEITVNRATRMARSDRAVGGWAGAPDYSMLPPELDEKGPDTDPLPPWRTSASDFYQSSCFAEYLTKPNNIIEGDLAAQSVLDTLYATLGGSAPSGQPVVTYYHGTLSGPVLFMGTPLWYYRRDHGIQLVDFVLQRMWGLTRRGIPR